MMAGLVLILLACILILIALLVSFRILPSMSGGGAGYTAKIDGTATHDIPPTPPYVRNAILGFFGLVSLMLMAAGLYLIIEDTRHSWQVDDALRDNQARLAMLALAPLSTPATPTRVPAGPATPTPPGPRPSPAPPTATPALGNSAARDVFSQAVVLDRAGSNAAAIDKYKIALTGDLDPTTKQAAQLEVGLLSLISVREGDVRACDQTKSSLQPLSTSATDSKTRQTASDAYKQAVKLCG